MRGPKKNQRQRRFHPVDRDPMFEDEHELPDWVAGAYKWRSVR